jgi:hypothetical protein
MMADALAPIAGLNRQEFAIEVRRQNLKANAKAECRALDPAIVQRKAVERTSRTSLGTRFQGIQGRLLVLRKRYKELGC